MPRMGHESLLKALMAATPDPPGVDADPADVMALAEQMLKARAEILASAAPDTVPSEEFEELLSKDRAWSAALMRAKDALRDRIVATARHRRLHRR